MNYSSAPTTNHRFRSRVLRGDLLLGAMLKSPTFHATEIFAGRGFDFFVIDEEHAPFDRHDLDGLALAAGAGGIARWCGWRMKIRRGC